MLDFSKLQTPPGHGDVLVMPDPGVCSKWAPENHRALGGVTSRVLGRPLAEWRRETRRAIVGRDDTLVIVVGHQPAFIHPGVWAKHIVAQRLARVLDGVALNLVVDNDAPKSATLAVPTFDDGRLVVRNIPFAEPRAGYAYEQICALLPDDIERFAGAVRDAMGDRYAASQMPHFFTGFSGDAGGGASDVPDDWVGQAIRGRCAVERRFGVELAEHRVSRSAYTPLMVDMLLNAERFAQAYNRALASYRVTQGVRDPHRPIPDLMRDGERVELPVWVYRSCEARRRLFVTRRGDTRCLFADQDEIGAMTVGGLQDGDALRTRLGELDGWRLRPRALTLTIWARLLLADLFIHGIGGAKYDRMSDAIMADYYEVAPPRMACVSATLHLDLAHEAVREEDVYRFEHELRDVRYNPQRHLRDPSRWEQLVDRRSEAVERSRALREHHAGDHRARRAAFKQIRAINAALLGAEPGLVADAERRVLEARRALRERRIATGREYFFGLYGSDRLTGLLDALPDEREFRL